MTTVLKFSQHTIVRAHVTGSTVRKRTVAEVAAGFHAGVQAGHHSFVCNASSWYGSTVTGQWYSDGNAIKTDWFDWRPVLGFDPSHKAGMQFRSWRNSWYPEQFTIWNGFALTRRLIVDGAINSAYVENNEINNFLGFGVTADRSLAVCWADGWDDHHEGYAPQGVIKTQGANALIDVGVIEGGDGDYGGSLTVAIDGEVINDWYNDGLPMREVWSHMCLELSEIPGQPEPPDPPPAGTYDEIMARVDGGEWVSYRKVE